MNNLSNKPLFGNPFALNAAGSHSGETPPPHCIPHTLTDKVCSLLKSQQSQRARRFPLPFHDHPDICPSYTDTQRPTGGVTSAFMGPIVAHTCTDTHSETRTLGVAASRNLGGSMGWQGLSDEVAEFRLWMVASVCPIVPGLVAVNTRS